MTIIAASSEAAAQEYKTGDRVECDTTETGKRWMKGTITPFAKGDFGPGGEPDGSWYHFKADANQVEYPCKPAFMRRIAGAAAAPKTIKTPAGDADVGQDNNAAATVAGDFLDCPISQKKGARPNAELFKKIIRCNKGEKAVDEGDEGAVRVDVSTLEIGAARPWSYSQDSGTGKAGTLVYPVKASYSVTTFYRNATELSDGWIRVLNFYVNAFGEWEIGSEIPIKGGKFKRTEKGQ